jgi:hypothetical protein
MKLAPALLILFVAICVNYLVVFINYRNEKKSKEQNINESVAGAMASKISSDAQQHRKNRERFNYIKSKTDKKE